MTTDRDSMSKEAAVDPNKPMSQATGSDDDLKPTLTLMDGDMVAAFARLERIITAMESEGDPNVEIIQIAKEIKLHYRETKTITKEQYDWIAGVAIADPGEKVPGPHGVPASEVDDPEADVAGMADMEERIKKMQAEKDKEAPPPPNIPSEPIIVGPKVTADVAPSGEEAVDGTPVPEPVVEEQPADAPDEPVAEEETVEEAVEEEETPEEETPQS